MINDNDDEKKKKKYFGNLENKKEECKNTLYALHEFRFDSIVYLS